MLCSRAGFLNRLTHELLSNTGSYHYSGYSFLHPNHSVSARLYTRTSRPLSSMMLPPTMSCTPSTKSRVLILGGGNFGSCLADHLGNSDHDVFMWSREQEIVDYFNKYHRNRRYLTDHEFPHTVRAIGPEFPNADLIREVDVLLFAIPTEGVR